MLSASSAAQSDSTIVNTNFWVGSEFDLPTKKGAKWGSYAEVIVQRANFLTNTQGWYVNLGATYFLKKNMSLGGGAALQYNVPYDDASLPYALPDYRVWQQFMIKNTGKINPAFKWANRFKFEEKWLGRRYPNSLRTEGYDYYKNELTFRWLIRVLYYPTHHFGFVVNNELFFRLLSTVPGEKLLDQNRTYAGIVYAFDDARDYRVELGYMQQDVWNAADELSLKVRINHVMRIMFHIEIPPF
jgi:hypothetical protein